MLQLPPSLVLVMPMSLHMRSNSLKAACLSDSHGHAIDSFFANPWTSSLRARDMRRDTRRDEIVPVSATSTRAVQGHGAPAEEDDEVDGDLRDMDTLHVLRGRRGHAARHPEGILKRLAAGEQRDRREERRIVLWLLGTGQQIVAIRRHASVEPSTVRPPVLTCQDCA